MLATLLDPLTKPFAKKWLGSRKFNEAQQLLKDRHRDVYLKIHSSLSNADSVETNTHQDAVHNVQEMDSNIKGPSDYEYSSDEDGIDLTGEAEEEDTGDLRKEADKEFDKLMNNVFNFNDYLYQGAKEIENVKCCGPKELIDKFDTQKFFWEYGQEHFLSIVILARVYFTQMETDAEQERVFSTAKRAMRKVQAQMGFEMLQMRTLLCATIK